jgi:hypothetical protein
VGWHLCDRRGPRSILAFPRPATRTSAHHCDLVGRPLSFTYYRPPSSPTSIVIMESVQSYVEKVREHTEDPDHLRANEALASLVEGRTSPADTANIITSIYAASLESDRKMPKSDRCSKFHEFWAPNFSDFVRHHSRGEAQERLIDLLVEISRQPDLRYKDGSAAMDDAGHVYWRDLPGWNFHFADEGLRKSYLHLVRGSPLISPSQTSPPLVCSRHHILQTV